MADQAESRALDGLIEFRQDNGCLPAVLGVALQNSVMSEVLSQIEGVRKRELVGVFRYLLALPRASGRDTTVGELRDAVEGANGGTVRVETVQGG